MRPRLLLKLQKPKIVRKILQDLIETRVLNKIVADVMANATPGASPPILLDEFPRKKDDV